MSESNAASVECSPSAAPPSSGKKKRKKKKKSTAANASVATSPSNNSNNNVNNNDDVAVSSSRVCSSPELDVTPLVNGLSSPAIDDGSGAFVDAVVSLPNGAIGGGGGVDRDSNVSPVSFHSLDSNDSALLANPDITFEFNASIPPPASSSSSVVVAPAAITIASSSSLSAVFDKDNDAATTKKQTAGSSNTSAGKGPGSGGGGGGSSGGGKKIKKSTAPVGVETSALEMAVNAYTCHTPKVVLAAQNTNNNPEAQVKNIRRQTSKRVEEADVQFQVALPMSSAVDDDGGARDAKNDDDAMIENNNKNYDRRDAAATVGYSETEPTRTIVKDPWNRIHRHADPALVSQHGGCSGAESGAGGVNTSSSSSNKRSKTDKKSTPATSAAESRDCVFLEGDMANSTSSSSNNGGENDEDVVDVSGKPVLSSTATPLPLNNAQRPKSTQEQIDASSLQQQQQQVNQDSYEGSTSPDWDTLSTPLSTAVSEDPSVTVSLLA